MTAVKGKRPSGRRSVERQARKGMCPSCLRTISAPFCAMCADTYRAIENKNTHCDTGPAPNPRITYLPNLQDALKSHMHTEHRLGYANSKTGYYSYYQSLLPHVDKKISNGFRKVLYIHTHEAHHLTISHWHPL
eukprot:1145068-Pelagomonas_calceolata.AAC.9